jgi:Planctomycete cytochrome C
VKHLASWMVVLVSCTSNPDTRPETAAYITQAILVPYCGRGGCHSTNTAAARLVFDTLDGALAAMHDRAGVSPGRPDQSTLYTTLVTGARRPMPPDVPLPDADVELIRSWIADGAEGFQ